MTKHSMKMLAVGAMTAALAAPVTAQQQLFSWSGRVDQEVQLTFSGRSLKQSNHGRRDGGTGSSSVMAALPRESGVLTVTSPTGRGEVTVIQQPSAINGYTAIIRIHDPQPGASDYQVNGYWQGSATGEVGPPFGRGRGYGRVRDMRDSAQRAMRDSAAANPNYPASRVALHWSGDVDENLHITLGSSGISYRTVSGKDPRAIESSFKGIPQGATHLTVQETEARGSVVVVQQPSAANNYTASVRVLDPQRGYGHYAFDLIWR